MPNTLKCRLPEHDEKGGKQHEDRIEPVHGNLTHPSSRLPRLAAGLTRATLARPDSTECTSTILPIGMFSGKTPPLPLVLTHCPGFKFAFFERKPISTNPLSRGPEAPTTPRSPLGFSTRAATLQFGSPKRSTCERVRLTWEMRPTRKPSGFRTGRALLKPSRVPRSI